MYQSRPSRAFKLKRERLLQAGRFGTRPPRASTLSPVVPPSRCGNTGPGGSGSGNEEAGCRPENWSSVTNSDPKRPVEFGRFRGCRSSGQEVGGKSSCRVGGEEIRGHYDQGQILRPRSNCLSCFRVRDFGHFGAWKDAPWGGQIERKLSGTAEFEHCYSRKGGGDYRQTSPSSFVCSRVANL